MNDDKVHCMRIARKYENEYWDGDRRYGTGGYRYIAEDYEFIYFCLNFPEELEGERQYRCM